MSDDDTYREMLAGCVPQVDPAYVAALEAERDRLRAAARDLVAAAKGWARVHMDPDTSEDVRLAHVHALARSVDAFDPMLGETTDALDLSDATAERDRLRAVVEAVREYRTVMKTRTANLNDGSPDFAAEGELSDRARTLTRTIDEALEALDAKEGT